MGLRTKSSTETTRTSKKRKLCDGIEEYQNHNLTGSRRKFGKIRGIYTQKIKNKGR
jgi:hypothetical protein